MTLKNDVMVTRFELGLCHALVLLCTKFGEIFLETLSGNHLAYARPRFFSTGRIKTVKFESCPKWSKVRRGYRMCTEAVESASKVSRKWIEDVQK